MTVPVDNQSRGQFRAWRAAAMRGVAALSAAFDSPPVGYRVDSLFLKRAVGRPRALQWLRRTFEGCGARWVGTPEMPRWSYINPEFNLFGEAAPVIAIGAIWADRGAGPAGALFNRPVWCFAASEHACLRFYQRSPPGARLDDALFEAHANVLGLSTSTLVARKANGAPFYRLAAGAGAFATDVIVADKRANNGLLQTMLMFGRTWLHEDALSERQESQIVPAGEVGDRFSEILWQPVA